MKNELKWAVKTAQKFLDDYRGGLMPYEAKAFTLLIRSAEIWDEIIDGFKQDAQSYAATRDPWDRCKAETIEDDVCVIIQHLNQLEAECVKVHI